MRWLTAPELMSRWILGAGPVEVHGNRLRMTVAIRGLGSTFSGQTVERSLRRLVRRYTLDGAGPYARTVTYDLAPTLEGCAVTCTVVTDIDGLPETAARAGRRAETRSAQRSLERLALGAEGKRGSPWRRSRDSRLTAQPL